MHPERNFGIIGKLMAYVADAVCHITAWQAKAGPVLFAPGGITFQKGAPACLLCPATEFVH